MFFGTLADSEGHWRTLTDIGGLRLVLQYKGRPVFRDRITYSVGPLGGCRIQINLKTHVTGLGMVPVPASSECQHGQTS